MLYLEKPDSGNNNHQGLSLSGCRPAFHYSLPKILNYMFVLEGVDL